MKIADAPPSGWYPDPRGGYRLRWWDGLDWTEDSRTLPNRAALERALAAAASDDSDSVDAAAVASNAPGRARRDTSEIITQVRDVTRSEIERAGEVLSQRADAVVRRVQPLITEYTNKFIRVVRIVGGVAALVLVAWFVTQFLLQASLFEWLGDRIDNITND